MLVTLAARLAVSAMVVLGCVRDQWTFPTPRDASIDSAALDAPAPDAPAPDVVAADDAPACGPGPLSLYRGEGSAIDSAGGQHAIASAGVSYVEGRFGQGFFISGPRAYVTIPASVGDFDGDFTIALWFKTTFSGEMLTRRAACWNGPSFAGEDLGVSSEGIVASEVFPAGSGYFTVRSPEGFNDGAWHHVALVRRGDTLDLVVDGTRRATHAMIGDFYDPSRSPSYLGVGRCTLGAWLNGTSDGRPWYQGALDEVAYYDRALSADELVAHAHGLCAP
ncbi:MAG: LamG domain-containing protein [Deltaproteobacteria bacterium]|nr:LamG domain-containing protein [Deltaproteobacteria bacterium]